MNKRNHKELWEQLKVLIRYGKQKRYSREELYKLMSELEVGQLVQDPLTQMSRIISEASKI